MPSPNEFDGQDEGHAKRHNLQCRRQPHVELEIKIVGRGIQRRQCSSQGHQRPQPEHGGDEIKRPRPNSKQALLGEMISEQEADRDDASGQRNELFGQIRGKVERLLLILKHVHRPPFNKMETAGKASSSHSRVSTRATLARQEIVRLSLQSCTAPAALRFEDADSQSPLRWTPVTALLRYSGRSSSLTNMTDRRCSRVSRRTESLR